MSAQASAFENISDKILLLLQKTKDALIRDIEKEFSSVQEAFQKAPAAGEETSQGFLSSVNMTMAQYKRAVDAIFARVGIDLSQCQNLTDFENLLGRPLDLLDKLGDNLEGITGADGKVDYMGLFQALMDTGKDVLQLIKGFQEVEYSKIKKELEDTFGGFYADFDIEEFALSILEHIMITLLRCGEDVFSEEVKYVKLQANQLYSEVEDMVDKAEAIRNQIEEKVNSFIGEVENKEEEVRKMVQALFKEALQEVEDVYDSVSEEVKKALNALQNNETVQELIKAYQKVSSVLATVYAVLDFLGIIGEKKLELRIPKKAIEAIGAVGGAISGELTTISGVIQEGVTRVTSVANGAIAGATGLVNSAGDEVTETVNDALAHITGAVNEVANQNIDLTVDILDIPAYRFADYSGQINDVTAAMNSKLKGVTQKTMAMASGFSYPFTITTFKWGRVERMFKDPIGYFEERYPVNSIDDVEKLTAKIIDLVRLFNPDIPDFKSLRGMLESLLRKLGELVLTAADDVKNELWKQVQPLMTMIRKVIDLLQEMYETLRRESLFVLKTIQDTVMKNVVEPAQNDLQKLFETGKKTANALVALIETIKVPSTIQTLYTEIIAPAVLDAIRKSSAPNPETEAKNLAFTANNVMTAWGEGVATHLQAFFGKDAWEGRLNKAISGLEATFVGDVDAVKSFLKPSLLDDFSAIGDKASALKDELDVSQYIKVVSNAFNDVSVPDPELYYEGFRTAIEYILSQAETIKGKYNEQQLKALAADTAAGIWERVRNKILNPLVRQVKRELLKIIREVIKQVLKAILEHLPSFDILSKKDIDSIRLFLNEAKDRVQDVQNIQEVYDNEGTAAAVMAGAAVVDKVIDIPIPDEWKTAAAEIATASIAFSASEMSYADVLTLVLAIYQAIPSDAVDFIKDILPSIPEGGTLDQFVDFVRGMDYKADLDQSFAFVTVLDVDSKDKDGKKEKTGGKGNQSGTQFNAAALLQLAIFAGEVPAAGEDKEKEAALYCMLIVRGDVALEFNIGKNHTMSLGVSGGVGSGPVKDVKDDADAKQKIEKLQSGVGFRIKKDWDFEGLGSTEDLDAMFVMRFSRKNQGDNNLSVFDTKYLSLAMANYPQKFYLGFANSHPDFEEDGFTVEAKKSDEKEFQVGYFGAIKGGEVRLKLQDVAFVKEVVKDDVVLNFDTYLLFDLHKGFDFGGGASLHLDYDLNHKKLGPIIIDSFSLDAGVPEGEKGKVALTVGTTFQVNFADVLIVAIENLGIGLKLNYLDENGDFGDLDLDASLKYPSGIGITVDATAVKGTGLISIDQKTGEFLGFLSLNILKKIGVSGFLLCDPGTAKGHDFSLVILLSANFSPGIPLGMGFSLTAIGGTLGLNRQISRDAIQSGVRAGTLDQVFFVGNLEEHQEQLSSMKSNIIAYFPAKKGQFFFGVLGQISFEPIVKCDFGLLLQLPKPTEIIIVGALRVNAAEGLVRINVYFAGGINFSEGMWFDASIVNSQIVGIAISGDMAFRLNWGGQKGFLLSIGGFHPAYKPEESLHVGKMNRLAMKLDYSILKISFETYLAVTSNTFQIGARFDLKIGWKEFGIIGYAGFDALFQFDPFLFMFYVCAGVSVKCKSVTLLSIDLSLDVQGPAPWRVAGKAKFKFLLIPVKVSFTKTWGKNAPALPSKTVEVFPLLLEQWNDDHNWTVDNTDLTGKETVTLINYKSDEMIIHPDGSITFNQSAVPLRTENALEKMDICNDAVPSDYDSLQIYGVNQYSEDEFVSEENDFAPTLFKSMTIQEKLDSPSYVKYKSGFTLNERRRREGKRGELKRDVNFALRRSDGTDEPVFEDGVVYSPYYPDPSAPSQKRATETEDGRSTISGLVAGLADIPARRKRLTAQIKQLKKEIIPLLELEDQVSMKKASRIDAELAFKSNLLKNLDLLEVEQASTTTLTRTQMNVSMKKVKVTNVNVSNVGTTASVNLKPGDLNLGANLDKPFHEPDLNHEIKPNPDGTITDIGHHQFQDISGLVVKKLTKKIDIKANDRRDRVSFDRYVATLDRKYGVKTKSTK